MVNILRYFRAYYERTEEATGLSIIEYDSFKYEYNNTISIQSIYMDKVLSNTDCQSLIFQNINNNLKENEHAKLQIHKFRGSVGKIYRNRMIIHHAEQRRKSMVEVRLAAQDALRRKSSITLTLHDPLYFDAEREDYST